MLFWGVVCLVGGIVVIFLTPGPRFNPKTGFTESTAGQKLQAVLGYMAVVGGLVIGIIGLVTLLSSQEIPTDVARRVVQEELKISQFELKGVTCQTSGMYVCMTWQAQVIHEDLPVGIVVFDYDDGYVSLP